MFEACPGATGEYLTSKSTTNAQHSKELVKPSPDLSIHITLQVEMENTYLSIMSISNKYIKYQRIEVQFER